MNDRMEISVVDFGQQFRRIMNDTNSLTELICKAVPEGEQREAELQKLRSTVRGFLTEHPNATLELMTPHGYLCLTPEDGKALLEGKRARIQPGIPGFACAVDADLILDLHICACNQMGADGNHYAMIAESPVEEETESLEMTM